MRELIYLWDNNGYTAPLPVLFQTDCHWTIDQLEKLTWSVRGAGRLATSFPKFKELLEQDGFKVILIKYGDPEEKLKHGIPEMRGATGNY